MKKIVYLAIIAIFIVSCTPSDPNTSISETQFREGTGGLEIEFLENAPPESVWESTTFQVGLDVKNTGAYDIPDSKVILNYETDYMKPLSDSSFPLNLRGKSISNPDGESDIKFINIKTKNLEPLSETHKSLVGINACYVYRTIVSEPICVDSDLYNRINDKACTSQPLELDSQGAPVAITRIVPKFFINDEGKILPSFMIFVENKGNGKVINKDKIADFCSNVNPGDIRDWNTVDVSAYLGGVGMDCSNLQLKLRGQNDFVQCTLNKGLDKPEAAYSSVIDVVLDYGYTFSISKEITIEKQVVN